MTAIVRWWRRRLCVFCWRYAGSHLLCNRHKNGSGAST